MKAYFLFFRDRNGHGIGRAKKEGVSNLMQIIVDVGMLHRN